MKGIIASCFRRFTKQNFQIHVILEESDQSTINSISKYNTKVIFQKGQGYGDALIEGINSVSSEFFVFLTLMDLLSQKKLILC